MGDQDDSIGLSSRWPRRAKSMDNAKANIASAKAALGATDDWEHDVSPF